MQTHVHAAGHSGRFVGLPVLSIGIFILMMLVVACGGGGGGAGAANPPPVAVNPPAGLTISSGAPPGGTVGVLYNHGNGLTCMPFGISCQPCSLGGSLRVCGTGYRYENSFVFRATGGVSPYTWAAAGLPPGLGVLTDGTFRFSQFCCYPSAAGTYNIVVTVTDSASPASQVSATYQVLINPPPAARVNTFSAPAVGAINRPYAFTFHVVSGGQPPLTWSETGALPAGLLLAADGTLAGTPTASGSFPITVMVVDALGQSSAPADFTLQIVLHGFAATGSMGTERSQHTATLLGNGKVLVAGGYFPATGLTNAAAELFDPKSGTFAPTGSMATARARQTATLMNNGALLVTGGLGDNGALGSAELFDFANSRFVPTGAMATARWSHTATLLDDGTVLVTGGADGASNPFASAELFDPSTGKFTVTGSMATPRYGHMAILLDTGEVLVAGGTNGPSMASAELYNPSTHTFGPTGSMATARAQSSATLLQSGNVLVVGGLDGDSVSTAEVFEPALGTFTLTGSMATTRSYHTATLLNDGSVLVIGGESAFRNFGLSSVELFDSLSGTFTFGADLVTGRELHAATLLNDGSVLVTGGINSGGAPLSSAELYQ